jgi:hypothetical protein
MEYTQEQILEKYKDLPEDVKNAMFSVDTSEIIQRIGRENQLTTEKIGILADEIGLFMLGITHPNEFIGNIKDRLGIEKEAARNIARQINEKVFQKIRESLRKVHGQEGTETPEPAEQPPQAKEIPVQPAAAEQKQPEAEMTPQIIRPIGSASGIVPEKEEIKQAEPAEQKITEEKKNEPLKPNYAKGVDPYREPIN